MADKSVITNIEARVRQLIDDHKRLSDLCAELTAQRDTLRSEKRTLEERVRELDAELARMQLTEGLAGGGRNREKARARVNRLMREVDKCIALLGQPLAARRRRRPNKRPREKRPEGRRRGRRNKRNEKMAKQAITLKIAGKSYPFNIESGKEEMYRLAEREVNSYLALIKQQNIKNWNDQDYLSMTRAEIRYRERRNAAEPGGGRRRPPTARKNRHGNRCVSERPEKVTGRRPPQTEGREGGGKGGTARNDTHRSKNVLLHTRIYPHRFLIALRN